MQKLGITREYFRDSLRHSLLITLFGVIVLTLVGFVTGFKNFSLSAGWLLFYLIVSVPFQELLFRGILQTRLYKIGKLKAVVLSSAVYAIIHLGTPLLVALTMAAGLAWGYSFMKKPNLFGPVLSHSILGVYLFALIL